MLGTYYIVFNYLGYNDKKLDGESYLFQPEDRWELQFLHIFACSTALLNTNFIRFGDQVTNIGTVRNLTKFLGWGIALLYRLCIVAKLLTALNACLIAGPQLQG